MWKIFESKDASGGALSKKIPGFLFWVFYRKTMQRFSVFFLSAGLFVGLAHLYPVVNIDPFSDLGNYYYDFWRELATAEISDVILRYEPGFVLLAWVASKFVSFSGFLWLLKFVLFYAFFLLLSSERRGVYMATLVAVLGMSYYLPLNALASLVIRQGVATAVFFCFLAVCDLDKVARVKALGWALVMIAFHYSSVFVLFALLLYFYLPAARPFQLWLAFLALYCTNISGKVGEFMYSLLGMNISSLEALNGDFGIEYMVGFKLTFLLLSIIFIVVPLMLSRLGLIVLQSGELVEQPWFRLYFLLNSLATIFSALPFHDRFFMWSWVLGPALVIASLRFRVHRNRKVTV
ncbi:EpsG family protein [Massilia sp. UMI-21]|nr:EpsG family protein [Massilia sp. UMI-21]